MSEPYHRFVFDPKRRRFVGAFEEMYRGEDAEGYDSWHQENVTTLARRVALAGIGDREHGRILDVGCGKGAFTALLKTPTNEVLGIDVSETAVAKASSRYPDIEFRRLAATDLYRLVPAHFDLIVAVEVLSYLHQWREIVAELATLGDRLLVSLYLPPDPIGFVKSFDDLRAVLTRFFTPEADVLVNGEQLIWVGTARA